jgi:hypothetical protein
MRPNKGGRRKKLRCAAELAMRKIIGKLPV